MSEKPSLTHRLKTENSVSNDNQLKEEVKQNNFFIIILYFFFRNIKIVKM